MNDCDCHPTDPTPALPSRLPRSASRRDILKVAAAGAGLLALGPAGKFTRVARGAPLQQKRLIVINLVGGCDTTNVLIPTQLDQYFTRRPTIAIQPNEGLDLNSGPGKTGKYVLHPSLAGVAQMWRDGDVAAVNRIGYPNENLSHFVSQDYFSFGVTKGFGDLGVRPSGWIARFADLYAPTALGCVSVGQGRPLDFVGGTSNPFLVQALSTFRLNARGRSFAEETPDHLARLGRARKAIDNWSTPGASSEARTALLQAHDLSGDVQAAVESFTSNATYTTRPISRQLQDISRLIQGGFETKIFYTGFGGHDTHGAQAGAAGRQTRLMTELDDALVAFSTDMKDQGLWDDTAIVVMTEFGRRNFENGSFGTDHGHAFAELILGGNVRGGIKGTDLTNADLELAWLKYDVDFRSVYKEVLADHLGVNPEPVFPEALERTHTLGLF